MPLFLCRDSKQGLVGETATVQQAAVLRAWQRLRWLAKRSRALCNLLTLSELSETSLEPGPLGIHEEEEEECFSKQAVVQQPPFFTTPPLLAPFLDRGNPPLFKLMVCSAEA